MSRSVDNAISFTHALTKHLLHVPNEDAPHILIAVLPLGETWKVRVTYRGFHIESSGTTLTESLEKIIEDLTARVSAQLDEGVKLLNRT